MPVDAEQHQTFLTPSIATGFSADNASASRLLTPSEETALLHKRYDGYRATARATEAARNCEIYVPPSNSNMSVKSAMTGILPGWLTKSGDDTQNEDEGYLVEKASMSVIVLRYVN